MIPCVRPPDRESGPSGGIAASNARRGRLLPDPHGAPAPSLDLETKLVGKTLSHFKILSQLGEGGMGEVYEAEDTRLGRRVAIKILPPEQVGSEERRLRFLREARAAASVEHPRIAAVHEVDEADGVVFIAMELVRGRTLRTEMKGGRLPLAKALRVAAEVADALASAHAAGIVHRDLKPENVMIRGDGHVKVLDFGLAKLREDPPAGGEATRMDTVSAEMTKQGRVFGTAAYMSPEQARGQAVDARSDIFSLGIVLYEMVTGRSPFHAPTITDTLSSIVRDQPRPAAEVNPDVPGELGRILEKCLEKDADERYLHTDELAADLRKLRRTTDSQPVASISAELPAAPRRRWVVPAAAAAAVVVLASILLIWRPGLGPGGGSGRQNAIAVLPFENLLDEEGNERLGQVLQELIITDLSTLESITVFSSQRLFDLRKQIDGGDGRSIDRSVATEVAVRAGAGMMLTGSLSRLGSNWIVTGQLLDVSSGHVIKSERIDGSDLYAMVDELTRKIRADLNLSRQETAGADVAVSDLTTSSLEAHQKYLEGAELLDQNRFKDAMKAFQEAVSLDPSFGLARYKQAVAIWWAFADDVDPETGTSAADLLADLLEGDYKLGGKDRSLAQALLAVLEERHADAERLLERLVGDHPDDKEAWYVLGEARYHGAAGDPAAAFEAFQRAMTLDPTFQLPYRHLREMYQDRRDYARGIQVARSFLEKDPGEMVYYQEIVDLLVLSGDVEQADAVVEEALGVITAAEEQRTFLRRASYSYSQRDSLDEKRKELLDRALAVDTEVDRDYILYDLGNYHRDRLENRRAEEYYLQSLDLNPKGPGALDALFDLYAGERRYAEGILRARSFIEKDPEHIPYYRAWVRMAIEKGDEDEADRAVSEALGRASSDPERQQIWDGMADAHRAMDDIARWLRDLREVIKLSRDPDSGWRPAAEAEALIRLRRYDEARQRLQPAAGRSPQPEFLYALMLMRIAIETEDFEGARRFAQRIGELLPSWPWVQTLPIEVELLAGRAAEAESLFQRALDWAHRPLERRRVLTESAARYLDSGHWPEAERAAREAKEAFPEGRVDVWTSDILTWALIHQERFDEAESVLQEALALRPRNADLLFTYSALDILRGRPAPAERRVREVLADGPAHKTAFELLAFASLAQGRFAEAEEHARRVLSMEPNRVEHALLAWILIEGGSDLEEGIDLARKALDLPFPEGARRNMARYWPSAEHALGVGYLKQGRHREAVEILEKAAAAHPDREEIQQHLAEARTAAAGR